MNNVKTQRLFSWSMLPATLYRGLIKLNPIELFHNPVIFATELGALAITLNLFLFPANFSLFSLAITLWLWFPAYFATFSEAMAEMRNRAQADALRSARQETTANRITEEGDIV